MYKRVFIDNMMAIIIRRVYNLGTFFFSSTLCERELESASSGSTRLRRSFGSLLVICNSIERKKKKGLGLREKKIGKGREEGKKVLCSGPNKDERRKKKRGCNLRIIKRKIIRP